MEAKNPDERITMNRIVVAIEQIRPKCDALGDKREAFEQSMAVEFDEHFAFQNAQARCHASGKITTEEAQIIYVALGEVGSTKNGGWAADTDLPTKVAVTLAMGELLGR